MTESEGGAGGGSNEDIEKIVSSAIGDSVTPSRLLNPGDVGAIRRLLGHESIDGPVHPYLHSGEQLHYLLHSTSSLSFPANQDDFDDDNFVLSGSVFVSPTLSMVTDQRIIFIYKNEGDHRIISIPYSDISQIEYHDSKIERKLRVGSDTREIKFGMWVTDPFADELSVASTTDLLV